MRTKIILLAAALLIGGFLWFKYQDRFIPVSKQSQITPEQQQSLETFLNETLAQERPQSEIKEKVVKSSSNPPSQAEEIKFCTGEKSQDFDCLEKYYTKVVEIQGAKAAFAGLKEQYDQNSYVKSQCHPLVHVVGRVNSQKYSNVGEAYAEGDSFCWSGYYHGVMEGIIGRIGYSNLVSQMEGICKSLAATQKYQFDHYNCVHGLGHGVMAVTNDELFESLEICDALTDSWERASCWSGVFMENIIIDGLNHVTNYLRPAEPLYPCSAVGDQYKSTCYLMQTSYMLKVTSGSYGKVFGLCSQVEEAYRTVCYQSLGRDISGRSISNVDQTLAGCALGTDEEQREYCIIGAVKDFISYFYSDVQARELCGKLTETKIQETCFATVESYYQLF